MSNRPIASQTRVANRKAFWVSWCRPRWGFNVNACFHWNTVHSHVDFFAIELATEWFFFSFLPTAFHWQISPFHASLTLTRVYASGFWFVREVVIETKPCFAPWRLLLISVSLTVCLNFHEPRHASFRFSVNFAVYIENSRWKIGWNLNASNAGSCHFLGLGVFRKTVDNLLAIS